MHGHTDTWARTDVRTYAHGHAYVRMRIRTHGQERTHGRKPARSHPRGHSDTRTDSSVPTPSHGRTPARPSVWGRLAPSPCASDQLTGRTQGQALRQTNEKGSRNDLPCLGQERTPPQGNGAFLGAFSRVYVCDPSDIPKGQRKGGSLEDFPQLFR